MGVQQHLLGSSKRSWNPSLHIAAAQHSKAEPSASCSHGTPAVTPAEAVTAKGAVPNGICILHSQKRLPGLRMPSRGRATLWRAKARGLLCSFLQPVPLEFLFLHFLF